MAIHYIQEDRKIPVKNRKSHKEWLTGVIKEEKRRVGVINYVFVSDNYLLKINRQFMRRDYFTDVISFNYGSEKVVAGDILVSVDRVYENADKFKVERNNELDRIMVHGLLHLIGYEDTTKEEKSIMTQKENYYLKKR
ncbi:MAG: rRNA maturation RNase YbeY [Spirochaetaceae bacterium]|nr:rRNA maturation RNase YbeY [Spirochaetaceae bacterium]